MFQQNAQQQLEWGGTAPNACIWTSLLRCGGCGINRRQACRIETVVADQFDSKVRAPLWFTLHDVLGEMWHEPHLGETGWHKEYYDLEERLKRRLGLFELSSMLSAGDAIQAFIKNATADQLRDLSQVRAYLGTR
jgi:hypothetical protein